MFPMVCVHVLIRRQLITTCRRLTLVPIKQSKLEAIVCQELGYGEISDEAPILSSCCSLCIRFLLRNSSLIDGLGGRRVVFQALAGITWQQIALQDAKIILETADADKDQRSVPQVNPKP